MTTAFPMTVPGDDQPRTFGAKLLNLLEAGALDRKAAKRMRAQAVAAIKGVNEKLTAAQLEATAVLNEFHEYKRTVFDKKVSAFSGAYSLVNQSERSRCTLQPESRKLANGPQAPVLPAMSSGVAKAAAGLIIGGIVGGALGYGLLAAGVVPVTLASVAITALSAFPALAIAMWTGTRHAANMRATERRVVMEIAQYVLEADARLQDLEKVKPGVTAMTMVIDRLGETLSSTQVEVLDPVLADGNYACRLLTSILRTSLLDGEGALLDGLIEKLQSQQADVSEIQNRLAA